MEKKMRSMGISSCCSNSMRLWRLAKTLFFLLAMTASLLLCCAPPLLVATLDFLLPTTFLALSDPPPLSLPALAAYLVTNYSFRASLLDVPLLSAVRSLLILCVYGVFGGRGAAYLGTATICSVASVGYVSLKAVYMFDSMQSNGNRGVLVPVEALFLSSLALGLAHIVAAYRTSCRERKKLLVYRIDIEAVSPYKGGIPSYQKIALSK